MTDIFISYAREDRARIERLSDALEAEGFSVWWDRDIAGGTEFSKETEVRLNAAKAVLVAWSTTSVSSMWVADEATIGRDKGNLVPVALDDSPPKIGFRQIQTIALRDWRGDRTAMEFQELVRSLKARLAGQAPPPARREALTIAALLRRRRIPIVAAVGAALAIGGGYFLVRPFASPAARQGGEGFLLPEERRAASGLEERSEPSAPTDEAAKGGVGLAVVPFTNLSSDPEQEHFVDGLTEELLNWLGNVEGLRVPGRTSSFQFKGERHDLRTIGERLAVDYILEGSVRRSGDSLRITAQLIDAKTGYHRWSQTYDRELAEIFAIQDEIARLVVTELLGRIPETGAANPAAVGDVDARAHELYLEGRALWTEREVERAFEKFRAAVEIDPRHAFAQAYFAVTTAMQVHNDFPPPGIDNPDEAINKALAEAVRLKGNAADVLFAKAWVAETRSGVTPDYLITDGEIVDAYEAAVRANPRHVEALHALARAEPSPEKVVDLYKRILEIDPGHLSARINLVTAYEELGDRAKAQYVIRQGLNAAADRRYPWAGKAKEIGDLALYSEALFADWEAFSRDKSLQTIAGSLLADLGAVEEARYLLLREATTGDPTWREYWRISIAVLDGDAAAELAAAEAFHRSDAPDQYSSWKLADARIRTGDYLGAYDVIAQRRPDIVAAKVEREYRPWTQFADPELVTAAHALDRAGRRKEAQTLWNDALKRAEAAPEPADWNWMDHLYIALLHSRLGDEANAMNSFRAAHRAGFRYLKSYNCADCLYDGFSDERGLFAELVRIPEVRALVDEIEAENEKTLRDLDARYGVLDKVRAMMAADRSVKDE